jgi:hypothetical protein
LDTRSGANAALLPIGAIYGDAIRSLATTPKHRSFMKWASSVGEPHSVQTAIGGFGHAIQYSNQRDSPLLRSLEAGFASAIIALGY